MITRLSEVAALRMAEVSSISAMKVETPRIWQSPAPTRAKIASLMLISAPRAGTNIPTCARRTATPTCRM